MGRGKGTHLEGPRAGGGREDEGAGGEEVGDPTGLVGLQGRRDEEVLGVEHPDGP